MYRNANVFLKGLWRFLKNGHLPPPSPHQVTFKCPLPGSPGVSSKKYMCSSCYNVMIFNNLFQEIYLKEAETRNTQNSWVLHILYAGRILISIYSLTVEQIGIKRHFRSTAFCDEELNFGSVTERP